MKRARKKKGSKIFLLSSFENWSDVCFSEADCAAGLQSWNRLFFIPNQMSNISLKVPCLLIFSCEWCFHILRGLWLTFFWRTLILPTFFLLRNSIPIPWISYHNFESKDIVTKSIFFCILNHCNIIGENFSSSESRIPFLSRPFVLL